MNIKKKIVSNCKGVTKIVMSWAGSTRDLLGDVSGPPEAALRAQNSAYIAWDNSISTDLET